MISPLSPPEVGAVVVCFCVSYEGPMVPRSFDDKTEIKVILHMHTYTVVLPTQLCHADCECCVQYLVQQAKFWVFLLRVFASRVGVLFDQENISLFTL